MSIYNIKVDSSNIINNLKSNAACIKEAISIKGQPGIYALFFVGSAFPISNYKPRKNEIIYIGKTQSSGISRVINTHFCTGRTGSSTIRRTIGALLKDTLGLRPIPRNESDITKGRVTFKFDEISEEKLTTWITDNLEVAFQPILSDKLQHWEKTLIRQCTPIFNLKSNEDNKYLSYIKGVRRQCGLDAFNREQNKK